MIEFKTGRKQNSPLVFANVEEDQFFVDMDGYLCQKYDHSQYNTIADRCGTPIANSCSAGAGDLIQKILPRVTKITFPGMEQDG